MLLVQACASNNAPDNEVGLEPLAGARMLASNPQFTIIDPFANSCLTRAWVAVTGQPFTRALRLTTAGGGYYNPWDCRVKQTALRQAQQNDVLVASFYLCKVSTMHGTGNAYTRFTMHYFEENVSDELSVQAEVKATSEWQKVQIPFVSRGTYSSLANLYFEFWVGYSHAQEIEIGGVDVRNYGQRGDNLGSLGLDWYAGRESSASWRQAAEARINRYRKAPLTVRVIDADGNLLPNAQVSVWMQRHAFNFGCAVNDGVNGLPGTLTGSTPTDQKYQMTIVQLCNTVTPENSLKWKDYEENSQLSHATLDVLPARGGIDRVRQHTLVWPKWAGQDYCPYCLPEDIQAMEGNPNSAVINQRIHDHIMTINADMAGYPIRWIDVLNESVGTHAYSAFGGDTAAANWFKWSEATDGSAKQCINDTAIFEAAGSIEREDELYRRVKTLLRLGAPLECIGIQGHIGMWPLVSPERLYQGINRFANSALNMEIHLSELDLDIPFEGLQADYMRDVLTLWFSHPAVTNITLWSVWDGNSAAPGSPVGLYRQDWSKRPSGEVFEELVLNQWWTSFTKKTNARGEVSARVFLGSYELLVQAGGKQKRVGFEVSQQGKVVTVRMPR